MKHPPLPTFNYGWDTLDRDCRAGLTVSLFWNGSISVFLFSFQDAPDLKSRKTVLGQEKPLRAPRISDGSDEAVSLWANIGAGPMGTATWMVVCVASASEIQII